MTTDPERLEWINNEAEHLGQIDEDLRAVAEQTGFTLDYIIQLRTIGLLAGIARWTHEYIVVCENYWNNPENKQFSADQRAILRRMKQDLDSDTTDKWREPE